VVIKVDEYETIIKIIEQNKGFVTSAQVTDAGLQRRILSELVASNRICRVGRGIYAVPATWEDDMYFLQYRYAIGISTSVMISSVFGSLK
jgi:predicted transcriptional regulator of viral defense system